MESILVAGATGAIGRELVAVAAADDRIRRIVALSRKVIPESEWATAFPGMDIAKARGKLEVVAVDWEALTQVREANGASSLAAALPNPSAFTGHTLAAMCMGTTKKDAGSAEAFRRVDLDFVETFIALVKHMCGTTLRHFTQISSQGADASSCFLYMRTKGEADACAVAAGFRRTSVYRPGMLNRKDKMRSGEKMALCFLSGMDVANVATAILCEWMVSPTDVPPSYGSSDASAAAAARYLGNGDVVALADRWRASTSPESK